MRKHEQRLLQKPEPVATEAAVATPMPVPATTPADEAPTAEKTTPRVAIVADTTMSPAPTAPATIEVICFLHSDEHPSLSFVFPSSHY